MISQNYKLKLYIDDVPIAKVKADSIKPLDKVFKQFKLKIQGYNKR